MVVVSKIKDLRDFVVRDERLYQQITYRQHSNQTPRFTPWMEAEQDALRKCENSEEYASWLRDSDLYPRVLMLHLQQAVSRLYLGAGRGESLDCGEVMKTGLHILDRYTEMLAALHKELQELRTAKRNEVCRLRNELVDAKSKLDSAAGILNDADNALKNRQIDDRVMSELRGKTFESNPA